MADLAVSYIVDTGEGNLCTVISGFVLNVSIERTQENCRQKQCPILLDKMRGILSFSMKADRNSE